MASLLISSTLLRQTLRTSRSIHSIHCTVCRQLQTTAGKRNKKIVQRNSYRKRKRVTDSEVEKEASDGSMATYEHGQWEKLKDGVTSTVSGIRAGVDNLSKSFKHQVDASTNNLTVNAPEAGVKFAQIGMTCEPLGTVVNHQNESVQKNGDTAYKEMSNEPESSVESRVPGFTTAAEGEKRHDDMDILKDSKSESNNECVVSSSQEDDIIVDEWVESILEFQATTTSDQEDFHKYFNSNTSHATGDQQKGVDRSNNIEQTDTVLHKHTVKSHQKVETAKTDSTKTTAYTITNKLKDGVSYFSKPKKVPQTINDVADAKVVVSEADDTQPDPTVVDNKATEQVEEVAEDLSKMKNTDEDTETIEHINQNQNNSNINNNSPFPSTLTDRIKESVVNFSVSRKSSTKSPKLTETEKQAKPKPGQKPKTRQSDDLSVINRNKNPNVPKKESVRVIEDDKSYLDMIWNIPQSIQTSFGLSKPAESTEEMVGHSLMHRELIAESGMVSKTQKLTESLLNSQSGMSRRKSLEDLCEHLTLFPQFRHVAIKHKVIPELLYLRHDASPDIIAKCNRALALCGYNEPPKGRGIRMLSVDGGGMRGLIAIEMLERLEKQCSKPLHEMFDLVIGSSTGALIAGIIFQLKCPVAECRRLYMESSVKIFSKNSWTSRVKNMAQFDAKVFEEVVKDVVGEKHFMEFAHDSSTAKFAITSTLTNVPRWQVFMFRNYNLPVGRISEYPGTCNVKTWEAIRASTSAPIYYREFQLGEHIFMDGGCLANNPTALGIHECKLLWPDESFQCIMSLGNGRFDPYLNKQMKDSSLWQIVKGLPNGFIESATDTEAVHQVLKDTMDRDTYFRLCPYLSEEYDLSEINPDKIKEMIEETNTYLNKNNSFIEKAVDRLQLERLPNQKILDFAHRRRSTKNNFFFF